MAKWLDQDYWVKLGLKGGLKSTELMLFSPLMHDTNGQIIYYACVHTLMIEKIQDDFSVYMTYAHMSED